MVDKVQQGKDNRKKGLEFEKKVRWDLENKYNVAKWSNNIDLEKGFVPAKQKFIGGRVAGLGSGFPDFVAFSPKGSNKGQNQSYNLIFVEAKINGTLKKEEKLKMNWLLNNGYSAWVAFQDDNKEIRYRKFVELYKPSQVCRKPIRT